MVQGLTKQNLIDWGITVVTNEDGTNTIYRTGLLNGFNPEIVTRELSVTTTVCHHKYGKDKAYPYVVFSVNNKPKGILISRLIYAWFVGDIPDGYDVDHIDNNPFNNSPDNLQLLTRKENLAKRGPGRNQYTANMTDEEIYELRELNSRKKKINNRIHKIHNDIDRYRKMYNLLIETNNAPQATEYKKRISNCRTELKSLKQSKKDINNQLK